MQIALTGATGFIGRYIARRLAGQGHQLRCWYDRSGMEEIRDRLEWIAGDLGKPASSADLVEVSMRRFKSRGARRQLRAGWYDRKMHDRPKAGQPNGDAGA